MTDSINYFTIKELWLYLKFEITFNCTWHLSGSTQFRGWNDLMFQLKWLNNFHDFTVELRDLLHWSICKPNSMGWLEEPDDCTFISDNFISISIHIILINMLWTMIVQERKQ